MDGIVERKKNLIKIETWSLDLFIQWSLDLFIQSMNLNVDTKWFQHPGICYKFMFVID